MLCMIFGMILFCSAAFELLSEFEVCTFVENFFVSTLFMPVIAGGAILKKNQAGYKALACLKGLECQFLTN